MPSTIGEVLHRLEPQQPQVGQLVLVRNISRSRSGSQALADDDDPSGVVDPELGELEQQIRVGA